MDQAWFAAALWLALAVVAVLAARWLGLAMALSEIIVGTLAQFVILSLAGQDLLGTKTPWVGFLAGTGAVLLTFLAGAELDPEVFRRKWKESAGVGLVGFFAPFLGAMLVAHYVLGWPWRPSWLAGIALSTTSVAVVYAVMLEMGFNRTTYGKTILAACFVNDLGTVIALGVIFSPFTFKTVILLGASALLIVALPSTTSWFLGRYGGRTSELETKYLLLLLFGLGGLAVWSGSEAVLPAYIMGMALAGTVGRDHVLIRRLRTLTFGLLTPFYFIRAGSLVSIPLLAAAPLVLVVLFFAKTFSKLLGLLPAVRIFGHQGHDGIYYSLMMSTGLTFGTISALFGLNRGIIDQTQYSFLVAAVIGSAVIPTAVANAWFLPRHLLPESAAQAPAYAELAGEREL